MITLGQTQQTPEQPKTPIDWNAIFTGATNFATAYFGYRTAVKGGATQPTAPAPFAPAGPPTGMSNTTKTLLIGGGILAAGLIVYSLTKKK